MKSEGRNPQSERSPKAEIRIRRSVRQMLFGRRAADCLRIAAFYLLAGLLAALAGTGCAAKAKAQLREQNAYLAGQNAILQQQQAQAQAAGVTIIGAVQHPQVPWVAGLTLAQAVATANFVGAEEPKQISITRHGETATMEASVLLKGADIPLEIGDVVELR